MTGLINMNPAQRLVDYFVVSGLDVDDPSGLEADQLSGDKLHCPPLERPYKAKVLAHYPESLPWNTFNQGAVCMLCHPRGLKFKTQSDHRPATFHSFIITKEDGARNYGASLTFYEKVEDQLICSAMQTLQAMHMAELSNAQSHTLYSHLTSSVYKRSPKLSRKIDSKIVGSIYDMKKDVLFATKCISLISFLPLISIFEKFLRLVYDNVISISEPRIPIESYICNVIYEVPVPQMGQSLKFNIAGHNLVCQRPGASELPLCDYSLKQLFELLCPESVLSIFTSMLLEHQVLLFSTDFQRLMLVAEGVTSLMFPFSWQHVYVPILPASLTHFLDAPVPFIMGLHHADDETLSDLSSKANMCFVNIDTGVVELPDDLPEFPYRNQLIQDIQAWLKNPFYSRDSLNGNQRDSGFRDSFVGFDDSTCTSAENSKSGSMWSLPNKMEVLQQSEAYSKITALAKKTGVISSLDDISETLKSSSIHRDSGCLSLEPVDDHSKDLMTNNMLREVFLHYFLQMFNCYDHFVIQPPTEYTLDEWLNNRETMQTFDKTAFLGDQPEAHLPFLSAFIESQIFTSFIDNKLLSQWESMEANLEIFEQRLKKCSSVRDEHGDRRLKLYNRNSMAIQGDSFIEKRAQMAVTVDLTTQSIEGLKRKHVPGKFPTLSSQVLNQQPTSNRSKQFTRLRRKDRPHSDIIPKEELRSKRHSKLSELNITSTKNTNWKFVETLLKECKAKTKRILVEKMGQEAFELGHRESIHLGVEENTLIASLCDLLERIWSHGLQTKQGKSALWWHLLSFQEHEHFKEKGMSCRQPNDPALMGPGLALTLMRRKYHHMREISGGGGPGSGPGHDGPAGSGSEDDCPSGTQTWPIRRHRRKPSREKELPTLKPMQVSLAFDMKNIQQNTDLRTDVGCARAWVRLALEKKLLSTHFKELLSKQELTRKLYKRYAFLRCEDEREQFLFHLLSLNAVDFYCFTNTFTNIKIPYRVLIFPIQKSSGATTTANCWFSLAGQLRETTRIPISKHTLDVTVQYKNLGVLTTMRIGHDNAGMSPKWMVEHVLVRNEVTGHTYRFPCGRWLGKGMDDGALERLLIAEMVPATTDTNELTEKCRTPPRCRSPSMPRKANEPKLQVSDIQEMLGDAVNNLVKHFYKPEKEILDKQDIQMYVGNAVNNLVKHFYKPERERGSITGLLCGEYGLVYCMEHVFQCGFKSSKLFGKRFIWDFLEKVQEYFENLINDTEHYEIKGEIRIVIDSYCRVVSSISKASESVGKDGRFQLFVCIGVRDHMLQRWIKLLSKTPVCLNMYEDKSFLRDSTLVQYIVQLLDSLNEFNIQLEKALIKHVQLDPT